MNLVFVWVGAVVGFAVGLGLSSALGLGEAGWALITALAGPGWLAGVALLAAPERDRVVVDARQHRLEARGALTDSRPARAAGVQRA